MALFAALGLASKVIGIAAAGYSVYKGLTAEEPKLNFDVERPEEKDQYAEAIQRAGTAYLNQELGQRTQYVAENREQVRERGEKDYARRTGKEEA